jgi:tRNA A-37 threonylcarbamoyl transferase component Bud32
MVRNPRVPLAALAVLVAVPLVLPVADYLLEKIYQPVVQKELFGLINTVHEDERLGARQAQVRWLLWVCALAGSISILLLQIPLARSEIADRDDDPEEAGSYKDATLVEEPIVRCVGPGDRYRFEAEVGRGAMGIVYQARDTVLDRDVAVKELPEHLASDPEKNERFRGEARALANLTHPGVVQVYDLLDHERRTYLVMEFVKGGNLQELFDRSGQIPLNRACGFGLSIAQALAYVHETGIVHRDLKPSNILLTEEGLPKITDFGVARWTNESSLTADGAIIGSPNYMSPEQAAGKVADQRSDLYSFGVLLYWLITGTTPYSGDALAILSQHMTGTPRPPSAENKSISEEMDKAVLSLMEKDPGAREHGLKKAIAVLTAEARG